MARPNPFQSVREQETDSFFPPSGVNSPFMIEIRRMQEELQKRIQENLIPKGKPSPDIRAPNFGPKGTKIAQVDTGIQSDILSDRQSFFEGMVRRGMPPIAAAGFTGGVEQESSFNPLATGDKDPKTGEPRSFGVLQLQGPRRTAFFEFAKAANKDPNNIETQADFAMEEFRTTEQPAARALFGATTVEEAALAANKFFRASDPIDANRLRNALKIKLAENTSLGTPGSEAPSVTPVTAPVLPTEQPSASEQVPVPKTRARAPAPPSARVSIPEPPTPVTSPPAVRRQTSVPLVWQQAVSKFLQSRNPKDLLVVPKGSLPVILALMGKSARGTQ